MRRGNDARLAGPVPLSAGSSRLVSLLGFPAIWVLGNPEAVCLMTAAPAAGRGGPEYTLGCATAAEAARGRLVRTYTDVALRPPRLLVEGVVPDGASKGTLWLGGERHQPIAMRENAYAGLARAPLSVSYYIGGAHHSVPLPLAPGSPGALLGAGGGLP